MGPLYEMLVKFQLSLVDNSDWMCQLFLPVDKPRFLLEAPSIVRTSFLPIWSVSRCDRLRPAKRYAQGNHENCSKTSNSVPTRTRGNSRRRLIGFVRLQGKCYSHLTTFTVWAKSVPSFGSGNQNGCLADRWSLSDRAYIPSDKLSYRTVKLSTVEECQNCVTYW